VQAYALRVYSWVPASAEQIYLADLCVDVPEDIVVRFVGIVPLQSVYATSFLYTPEAHVIQSKDIDTLL